MDEPRKASRGEGQGCAIDVISGVLLSGQQSNVLCLTVGGNTAIVDRDSGKYADRVAGLRSIYRPAFLGDVAKPSSSLHVRAKQVLSHRCSTTGAHFRVI